MNKFISVAAGLAAIHLASVSGVSAKDLKVLSDKTVTGFGHVEIRRL